MFYGEYEHSIDKKGRVIIPSKFRDFFREYHIEKLYVTRGLDKCLFVFTENEWKSVESKYRAMAFTRSDSRKFNRLLFGSAVEIECDKQGRILLPKFLKDYSEIKKDIVIIGVSNRFEIWSKEVWGEWYKQSKGSFEEIAENLTSQEE
jgi:MraZ protein